MIKIALYLRISVDEATTDESNSIANQRVLLNQYLDQTPEFYQFERIEFTDDGFSGRNPNRPAFKRLMSDVKSGKIKVFLIYKSSFIILTLIEKVNVKSYKVNERFFIIKNSSVNILHS